MAGENDATEISKWWILFKQQSALVVIKQSQPENLPTQALVKRRNNEEKMKTLHVMHLNTDIERFPSCRFRAQLMEVAMTPSWKKER
jgi:hypothetical protein